MASSSVVVSYLLYGGRYKKQRAEKHPLISFLPSIHPSGAIVFLLSFLLNDFIISLQSFRHHLPLCKRESSCKKSSLLEYTDGKKNLSSQVFSLCVILSFSIFSSRSLVPTPHTTSAQLWGFVFSLSCYISHTFFSTSFTTRNMMLQTSQMEGPPMCVFCSSSLCETKGRKIEEHG